MRNGKTPGCDNIPAEIWKIPNLKRVLTEFIQNMWSSGRMQEKCNKSVVIAVPKYLDS